MHSHLLTFPPRHLPTVSIIIPALNEAGGIGATLASALGQPGPREVIVVDGSSTDGTPEVARAAGACVLVAARGRARQMNAGAAAATGSVFLFLHADTRLPEGALAAVRRALADPGVAGGCFRPTFDLGGAWMRLWSLGVWMRWHRFAFGDRALFVRRAAFEGAGGFPDQPLFEDLDLVRRVRHRGRFVFLGESIATSARRFRNNGALRQQARNTALWLGWAVGLPPHRLKRFYPDDAAHARDERGG